MLTTVLYLGLGLAWTFSSLIVVVAEPAYWEPVTPIDHVAVWTYSLAFALMAVATPVMTRQAQASRLSQAIAWITAAGALLAGIANGVEDGIGLEAWGSLYVIGALTFLFGLLVLGAALWGEGRRRFAAVAVLWSAGFALTTAGFGFLVLVGSLVAIDTRRRVVATT